MPIARYFAELQASRQILWSYVIWYLVMVGFYFSTDIALWTTSLGIGIIVGYALMLSTGPVSMERIRQRFWESLRLFLTPFLVSSFAAMVAGQQFVLVFSPQPGENLAAVAAIAAFLVACRLLRR